MIVGPMSIRQPVLTVPSALRLVEPMALRLVSGLVLGPLVASFLGGTLAWLSVPVGGWQIGFRELSPGASC